MRLAPGKQLGPYEITATLGAGGMGEVYRARDTRLERTVAIKILSQLSSDPAHRQRFEREAKAISCLNHPNICTLYDIGQQDGIDYLVMECVEGETLAKRLEKGPLPVDQVLKFGAQIADALDKAHRAGIIHRDLKPGNIMLTSTGAKLLDFGLAKPGSELVDVAMTATKMETPVTEQGTIVGTFQVHVSRAGGGTGTRRPQRHLLARRSALRDGHRPARLRGQEPPEHRFGHPRKGTGAYHHNKAPRSSRTGSCDSQLPREGPE